MASQMTETELKQSIKSLLTSSTRQATIITLQRDFREMIGEQIPFHKFGYNSVEHLLKNIPDTCVVRGTGPHALVVLVHSEKSRHVNLLVTQQKSNTKGKGRFSTGKRYNRAPAIMPPRYRVDHYNTNNYYGMSPNTSHSSQSCSYNSGTVASKLMAYENSPTNQNVQSRNTSEVQSATSQPLQNGSETPLNKLDNLVSEKSKFVLAESRSNVETWMKAPQPAPAEKSPIETKDELRNGRTQTSRRNVENWIKASGQMPDSEQTIEPLENVRIESARKNVEKWIRASRQTPVCEEIFEPLERLTISNEETKPELSEFDKVKEDMDGDTSIVPNRVQERLKTLISQFPEGIWVSELPKHYQKMCRRELLFASYGYSSLIEMCVALKHIFHYARPGKDDFKLYDKSKPLPDTAEKLYTIASYDVGQRNETVKSNQAALPELDWSDFQGHIPEDVFRLGKTIPRLFLPEDVKAESILDVVVVEVYDPSKFWIYLGTAQEDTDLDRLMQEIHNFYSYEDTVREYAIPPGLIKENLYCVQNIYGDFHRALIIHVYQEEECVKVFCIDYGSTVRVPMRGLCFLHNKFSEVPAQAIRCSLANIIPTLQGHPWPQTAKDHFRKLINGRQTKINISHIDYENLLVYVFLADVTNKKKFIYVNNELIREGHALWNEEKQETPLIMTNLKCKVENLHLFPTHHELEYGLSPSTTDIYSLDDMLVPLNFYLPNYFTLNDQDNKEKIAEQIDPSYIKTVTTKHSARYFANWINAVTNIHKPVKTDFSLFNDLKETLIEFHLSTDSSHSTIVNNERLARDIQLMEEDLFCDVEEELLPENTENKSPSHVKYSNEELLDMSNVDKELPNSVRTKLTGYNLLDGQSQRTASNSANQSFDEQPPIISDVSVRYSKEELLNVRDCGKELPDSVVTKLKYYKLYAGSSQHNAMKTNKQLFIEQISISSQLRYSKEELLNVRDCGKELPDSVVTKLKYYKLYAGSSQHNAMKTNKQLFIEQISISSQLRYSKEELLNIRDCGKELPDSVVTKLKYYKLYAGSSQHNAMKTNKQLFIEQISISSQLSLFFKSVS